MRRKSTVEHDGRETYKINFDAQESSRSDNDRDIQSLRIIMSIA